MAFPADPLGIVVELDLDGTWTDISGYVRSSAKVDISRGEADEQASIGPGRCGLTVDNRDGRFSPRNPTGPYYGMLKRNTGMRVYISGYESYLHLGNHSNISSAHYASAPDAAALDITGDIDIRVWFTLDTWNLSGNTILASKVSGLSNISWMLIIAEDRTLGLIWSTDGTAGTDIIANSTVALTPGDSLAVRATLDVDNGASGKDVRFYTSDSIYGTWTQIGSTLTGSGTTSVYSGTGNVELGTSSGGGVTYNNYQRFSGRMLAFNLFDGIGGTRVANPDFTARTLGETSFADDDGNTWTINNGALVTSDSVRYVGYVAQWPVTWDKTSIDSYVRVQADGELRRLQQGATPLKSTLYRTLSMQSGTICYWPLEDGSGSVQAAAIGGSAARGQGLTFGVDPGTLYGSSAVVTLASSGYLNASLPSYTTTSVWSAMIFFQMASSPGSTVEVLRIYATGTAATWHVSDTGTTFNFACYDSAGNLVDSTSNGYGFSGDTTSWVSIRLTVVQNGSNIDWDWAWHRVGDTSLYWTTTQSVAGTAGKPTSWRAYGSAASGGMDIGHVAFYSTTVLADNANFVLQSGGYVGEDAIDRAVRVAAEEEIPLVIVGGPNASRPMGRQPIDTAVAILEQCAQVDGGILYESRDRTGLAFRPLGGLYNALSTSYDYSASELAEPLAPVEDDRSLRNDITATRPGGSSARVVQETGPNNVQSPPDGVGRVDESIEVNVQHDSQLFAQAGWLRSLGVWDEARYPSTVVNLARTQISGNTTLSASTKAVDIGRRVTITNPPSGWPPDSITLLVRGYGETMDQDTWILDWQGVPAGPYDVAISDDADTARADSLYSTTAASFVAGTDTSLSVAVASGKLLWITGSSSPTFPLDIMVSGCRLRVSAISGASSPQTFTISATVVNGVSKTIPSGSPVRMWRPARAAL